MKKILILAFFIFLSCSNDQEVENSLITLTGKWYPTEAVINGVSFPYDDHETCGKDYIEFYGNNSLKSVDIFDCEADTDWIGTYVKTNNLLSITVGNSTKNAEIIELTSNSLILKYMIDNNNDGIFEVSTEKFTN